MYILSPSNPLFIKIYKIAKQYPDYGWEKHKGYGTPMHKAAIWQKACPIHHTTPFATCKGIDTAFIWSASNGDLDCVKYLVEQGADINHSKPVWEFDAEKWDAFYGRMFEGAYAEISKWRDDFKF